MNGIRDILIIMEGFGLLGKYSNLLVLGTGSSDVSKELYDYLKYFLELDVHNRPTDNFYDFMFIPKTLTGNLDFLFTKLRVGGIILQGLPEIGNPKIVKGHYLQINKSYGLVKNERTT